MKQLVATYAVIFQIVAIVLLQLYSVAPHLSRKLFMPQLHGNHVECNCSSQRFALNTCCCYQHKSSCFDNAREHGEEHVAANGKETASPPHMSAASCDCSPEFMAEFLDKLEFLQPDALLPTPVVCCHSFCHPFPETAASRFTEPPDPPPKVIVTA